MGINEMIAVRPASLVLAGGALLSSMLNGLTTSPLFDSVMFYFVPMLPGVLRRGDFSFYLNGVFIAVMSLALAGVPARIYERLRGGDGSPVVSHAVWFATAMLLAIPGGLGAIGYFEIE